ncbi:AsnC family transcriptional regulator [Ignicoccus pacificus DSM 13166]|uniref:siroheme decarboxylase n=1 Tax=Ignicoccus pacificus DSM 13166 TaxID=940294 RepID=A0A977K8R8_9CREN|nr:AsnC family transcriptional regulator [Ignicoccus pacificus DSM 13166]
MRATVLEVLTEFDAHLLNELQYNFPLTLTPFKDIAERLDVSENKVLQRTRELLEQRIIKRIGFTVNYKSQGKVAALVGVRATSRDEVEKLKNVLLKNPEVTHNYLRDDPDYQVWFTIKAKTLEDLKNDVKDILEPLGFTKYIILPSKKVCKVSVKYDLIRGIAWSPPAPQRDRVPRPEELGLPKELPKAVSRLKVVSRPYKEIAEKFNMSEGELLDKVKLMLEHNILRNPGASIDGDKVGFKYNVMVVMNVDNDIEVCKKIAENVWEASHVVAREVPPEWPYPVYFVLHAMRKEPVEEVIQKVVDEFRPIDYRSLYSIENLKPGIAR